MAGSIKGVLLSPAATESEAIGAASSTTLVLNKNALQVQGTASAADRSQNPAGILAGTVTNHANVIIVEVPPGAAFLDICTEWTGTAPTTLPEAACFGLTPKRPDAGTAQSTWPYDFDADFANPGQAAATQDWRPLPNLATGAVTQAVGSSTSVGTIAQYCGSASLRGPIVTFNVAGCSRIMVPVTVAGVGPTKAMIIGWFSK